MKGKNLPSSILRHSLGILTTLITSVALWDAVCSDEMMKLKDFYTDPQIIALIKAAESNDLDKLKQIVHEGIDPNTFGEDYMTPLFWALGHKNKKVMKALLAVGADPNLKDPEGDSPMAMAAGAKDTELLKILLDQSNPDAQRTGRKSTSPPSVTIVLTNTTSHLKKTFWPPIFVGGEI